MGINNNAVKETVAQIQKQVEELSTNYRIPILVEKFIDGPEITAVVFDDGKTRHVLLAEKRYKVKPDGKYGFTSIESYDNPNAAKFMPVEEELEKKVTELCSKASTSCASPIMPSSISLSTKRR